MPIFVRSGSKVLDTDSLRTFLELSRTRHFGKTAERLFVTQSAVSARIRQLEEALGVRLFIRHPRNLQLTESGRKLIPFASTIVSTWQQARLKVAEPADGARNISLGSVGSFWDAVMQDWFNHTVDNLPEFVFQIALESNDHLVQCVSDRVLDIAFVYDPTYLPHLKTEPVHELLLACFTASPDNGIQSQLAERYILVDWGEQFMAEHHQLVNDDISPVARVEHVRIALATILSVGGAAYLPQALVDNQLREGVCRRVPETAEFTRKAFAIYRDDNPELESVKVVMDNVKKFLSAIH